MNNVRSVGIYISFSFRNRSECVHARKNRCVLARSVCGWRERREWREGMRVTYSITFRRVKKNANSDACLCCTAVCRKK